MTSFNLDQPQKGTYPPLLPELTLSRERLFNHNLITIFADNPDVDMGGEVISHTGGAAPVFPNVAHQLSVVSTSVNDTAAGTGARLVRLVGLDVDFNPINEVVTLNGTTPVTTANSYSRINNMVVLSAGSLETNDGDVSISSTDPVGVMDTMPAGTSIATSSLFTVPSGMEAYVYTFVWSVGRKTLAKVDLNVLTATFSPVDGSRVVRNNKFTSTNSQGTSSNELFFPLPPRLPGKTDFWIKADPDINDVEVVTVTTFVLVDNENRQFTSAELY